MFYWRLCGLTSSAIVKYPFNRAWCAWSAEGSLKQWLPNGKLFFCISQNAMMCLAHCRQELQQKSWKLLNFFFKTKTKCSRPRPKPRLSFLSSRRLENKTLVSRTTSLMLTQTLDIIIIIIKSICNAHKVNGQIPLTCSFDLESTTHDVLYVILMKSKMRQWKTTGPDKKTAGTQRIFARSCFFRSCYLVCHFLVLHFLLPRCRSMQRRTANRRP